MDGFALGEKLSFKMLRLTFSTKLYWVSYIIAKTASKKIGAFTCSMKFLSPEVALYLSKSTIQPWFHFLFRKGGLLIILIDCMIFLSP